MSDTRESRALLPILIVAGALAVLVLIVVVTSRDPVVDSIDPGVASAGEEVMVRGRWLGESIETLSIAGRALPTSAIVAWGESEIRFVLPRDADSGLLFVETPRGRSTGVLLRVREAVPRAADTRSGAGSPVIETIDATELTIGGLVTITGRNFGDARRNSVVVFPMVGNGPCLPCREAIAYAAWSDSRIRVRVPDGASAGFLAVETSWGRSNPVRYTIGRPAGQLVESERAEIGVRYGAHISSVSVRRPNNEESGPLPGERDIFLHLPDVARSAAQRAIRFIVDAPTRYRFERVDEGFEREVVRTFLVDRYRVRSEIDPDRIPAAYENETGFYGYHTRPLPDLPVRDPAVAAIAARLRSASTAPYRIAEGAYRATIDALSYALGLVDRSALAGLATGYGDDFTYATLFVAVTRAAGVPARVVGGVLVTDDGYAYSHYWAEFFITSVGWIPVDPSLGDGAFPAAFPVPDDPRSFYFGNLDNYRVAFGRRLDQGAATSPGGVAVTPADHFAPQRSYAEAGAAVASFELEWFTPRLLARRPL